MQMGDFSENLHTSPLIILLSVKYVSIEARITYMYSAAEKIRRSYIMKECLNKNHLNKECKEGKEDIWGGVR
jgi:hypothetical protein